MSRDPFAWVIIAREAAGVALAGGTGVFVWLRKRSARDWPITFGRVESASSFQNETVWLTDIAYSYSVAAEFYSGQFQLRARSEKKAEAQVQRWKGQSIGIRYSPKSPGVSVVRMEDQSGLSGEDYRGH